MAKKMLIDATHPEETRVVVVDGQKVEDFDFESITKRQLAGNIYLAKVTRVEPSLQAAFIEYGGNRHGFLAFAEVHPDYYQIPVADREALLAEEEREEEARRAREDDDGEGGKPKRTRERKPRKERSRSRSKSKDSENETETTVAGLEVIDVVADDAEGDSPAGLEVTDMAAEAPDAGTPAADADAATQTASAEDAPAEEPVVVAEAPVEEAPEADAGDTPPDDTPKTMAENTGLDDDESVTEVVGDPASAQTVSGTEAQDAAPEASAEADAPVEAPADAPADAPAEAAPEAEAEAEAEVEKPKPRRRRAPRKSKKQEAAEAAASEETATGDTSAPGDETADGQEPAAKEANTDSDADTDDSPAAPDEVGAEDTLAEAAVARTRLRRKYKIQDVIKVRQILLVQVVKEERGNKGAALTTYLSLAGRYCVLMPNTARGGGISRKITNASDRKRLREVTSNMEVPKGMGLIVRTAGAERTKPEIKRDYEFLIRQWEQIRELTLKSVAPTLIYEEGSLIKRSIRDVYNKEIDQILVEGDASYREAKEYMKMLMPSHAKNVQPYTDQIPLFSRFQVESYLNGMFNPTVQLRSGGYIVIGITEALVAIDVNSGRATKQGSIEETAAQTNLEAADEVARQLRLRDLAGLIVIDFIDMDENRNNRAVEKRMKDRLKNDRARIQVGRISAFGLMEMSRQRLRPGMLEATTQPCPHCHGMGLIRSDENLSLSILREIEEEAIRGRADGVTVRAPIDVANYLINHKRPHVAQLEERHGITVSVLADPSLTSPNFEIERSKTSNRRVQRAPDVISASSVGAEVIEEAEVIEGDRGTESRPADGDGEEGRSRRRRGKRGGRRKRGENGEGSQEDANANDNAQSADGQSDDQQSPEQGGEEDGEGRSRGRRSRGRRRGGRGRKSGEDQAPKADASAEGESEASETAAEATSDATTAEPVAELETKSSEPMEVAPAPEPAPELAPEPVAVEPEPEPEQAAAEPEPAPEDPDKPKRRGWWSFGRS